MMKKISGSNIFKVSVITSGISNIYCMNIIKGSVEKDENDEEKNNIQLAQVNKNNEEQINEGKNEENIVLNEDENENENEQKGDVIQQINNINAKKNEKNAIEQVIINNNDNNDDNNEAVIQYESEVIQEDDGDDEFGYEGYNVVQSCENNIQEVNEGDVTQNKEVIVGRNVEKNNDNVNENIIVLKSSEEKNEGNVRKVVNNGSKIITSREIDVNFSVPDIKLVLDEITNLKINIEGNESYDTILGKINDKISPKKITKGFKMYNIYKKKDKLMKKLINSGINKINNIGKIIIEFDSNATGFVKKKEDNKIYIKIKFFVSDIKKFKLIDGVVVGKNDQEMNKDAKYDDLLNVIKGLLGNKEFKPGFKIYKNNKNTEFNSGALENGALYIFVFADDDTNFVVKKDQNPQPKPKQQDETITESLKEEKDKREKLNNSGTICFCGKNKDNGKKDGNGRDV